MEFQELIKEFDRMCAYYKNPKENPFFKETLCEDWGEWYMIGAYEPKKFEEIVMKWVQKHPKPVYPTIGELVTHMRNYLPERKDGKHWDSVSFEELLRQEVPEEVAEEFGIVPINECGLNKYMDK